MQSRERQQRAVEAMNSYLQNHSETGSIFVIQYKKDSDGRQHLTSGGCRSLRGMGCVRCQGFLCLF